MTAYKTLSVLAAASALIAVALPAHATVRVNTLSRTCDAVQSIIAQNGAAILRYNSTRRPDLPLYDRYVADVRFCVFGERTKREYVPTRDVPSCPVLSCIRPERERRILIPGD